MQLWCLGGLTATAVLISACAQAPLIPAPAAQTAPAAPAAALPVASAAEPGGPAAAEPEAEADPAIAAIPFFGGIEPIRDEAPKPWLAIGSGSVAIPDGGRATFAMVAMQPDPRTFQARVVVEDNRDPASPTRLVGIVKFLAREGATVTFAGTTTDGRPFTGHAVDGPDGTPDTFTFSTDGLSVDGPLGLTQPPGRVSITELKPKS